MYLIFSEENDGSTNKVMDWFLYKNEIILRYNGACNTNLFNFNNKKYDFYLDSNIEEYNIFENDNIDHYNSPHV